jgi:hypothetical protein
MNRTLLTSIAALAAAASITIAAGCGSSDSASVPTGADMKGTWVQTATGYDNGELDSWKGDAAGNIVIDKASGQSFTGYKTYTPPEGGPVKETMQGVIAPDGDILITDQDGFYEGTLENGTFTAQYAETGDDATAENVTWTKK